MNDEHDFDTLEEQLRTALSETAAQIAPLPGAVPTTEATVTPLRRQSRAWMPALAAAAVVLLLVGVVTLINRDDGGAPMSFDGPVDLTLMLPPGVSMDGNWNPPRQTYWDQAVGPYSANLFCGTYVDGECRSALGSASAWFDQDGTPSGRYGEYSVTVGFAVPEQAWLELSDGTLTAADDAEVHRPEGAVDVDINGHQAFAVASGPYVSWAIGDEMFVEVGSESGELDDVLEFARSLEEHTVPVPVHTPVVIATIDEVMILAGAWEGAELVVGEAENDVATDAACISTFPYFASERAQSIGYCGTVGELQAWDVPTPESLSVSLEAPDDSVDALSPPSPSGIVVGTAPLGTEAVEVTYSHPDGSTSGERVPVVGAEYGFTSGFFTADGGPGASLENVVISDWAVPTAESGYVFYAAPGEIRYPEELVGEHGGWWVGLIAGHWVELYCEEPPPTPTREECGAVGGVMRLWYDAAGTTASAGNADFLVTMTWGGEAEGIDPDDGEQVVDVVVDGYRAQYVEGGDDVEGEPSPLVWRPDQSVEVAVRGFDRSMDEVVEFARTLERHVAMARKGLPVLVGRVGDIEIVGGGCILVLAGKVGQDRTACPEEGQEFSWWDASMLPNLSEAESRSLEGFIVGNVPLGIDEVTLRITFADDVDIGPQTVPVVGPAFGSESSFFILEVGRGGVLDVEIVG